MKTKKENSKNFRKNNDGTDLRRLPPLCFGVFFIMLMMMKAPFENGRPLNEFQELCATYKSYYRFSMTEEMGRSCGHPDTDLLYSYDTSSR